MTGERTVQTNTRVPETLIIKARQAAARERPGISTSGMIRLALARLAGLPGDHYGDNLPTHRTRKIT